jgi:hypothetical protein
MLVSGKGGETTPGWLELNAVIVDPLRRKQVMAAKPKKKKMKK